MHGIPQVSRRQGDGGRVRQVTGGDAMRDHYDFARMRGEKNPYAKRPKQRITIRLDKVTVAYFKQLAIELGMPYQDLINLYLRDCAQGCRKLGLKWAS